MELKFLKDEIDEISFKEKIKVSLGKETIYISPIELQIAYKRIILKSEKDIEDAKYLEELFNEKLDKSKLITYLKKLK